LLVRSRMRCRSPRTVIAPVHHPAATETFICNGPLDALVCFALLCAFLPRLASLHSYIGSSLSRSRWRRKDKDLGDRQVEYSECASQHCRAVTNVLARIQLQTVLLVHSPFGIRLISSRPCSRTRVHDPAHAAPGHDERLTAEQRPRAPTQTWYRNGKEVPVLV
jgi:hypothetical protein